MIEIEIFPPGHRQTAGPKVRKDEGAAADPLHLDHQRRPGLPGGDILQGGHHQTVRSYIR